MNTVDIDDTDLINLEIIKFYLNRFETQPKDNLKNMLNVLDGHLDYLENGMANRKSPIELLQKLIDTLQNL
jgi:hypothetical protein